MKKMVKVKREIDEERQVTFCDLCGREAAEFIQLTAGRYVEGYHSARYGTTVDSCSKECLEKNLPGALLILAAKPDALNEDSAEKIKATPLWEENAKHPRPQTAKEWLLSKWRAATRLAY